MDWERLVPGHPGPGGRLGTKKNAQDQLTFLKDASEAVKVAACEGKCWEPAEKEVTLPKYENWPATKTTCSSFCAVIAVYGGAEPKLQS